MLNSLSIKGFSVGTEIDQWRRRKAMSKKHSIHGGSPLKGGSP